MMRFSGGDMLQLGRLIIVMQRYMMIPDRVEQNYGVLFLLALTIEAKPHHDSLSPYKHRSS